jgi:SAM-dependent methyltransferase
MDLTVFDEAYAARSAPWVIGQPQPVVVELARAGRFAGAVLDVGCGTGEHTVHLAELGHDVLGVDAAAGAIEQARAVAAERGVVARFARRDAFDLGPAPVYDTVLDSALFHVFGSDEAADDRARYVASLRRVCRPGAVVHLLALSDAGPGFGPQVSDSTIRGAFGSGWRLELLEPSTYRVAVVRPEHGALLQRPVGDLVDLPAWLARVRRRWTDHVDF